jgi:hypothetical protein
VFGRTNCQPTASENDAGCLQVDFFRNPPYRYDITSAHKPDHPPTVFNYNNELRLMVPYFEGALSRVIDHLK